MDKDKLKKEGLNLEGFEFKVSEDELMFFW
ncbi:MAG: hypothetical protein XD67_1369, partial [Thermodesulfobacterium commune]